MTHTSYDRPSRIGMTPSCAGCKHSINTCDSCKEKDEHFSLEDSIMFPGTQTWVHLSCGKEEKCCDCEEAVFPSLS